MSEAGSFYLADGDGFVGTLLSQGAWDPGTQTGIAVLALLGHVLEDLPTLAPMSLARLTVDIVRPVPIGRRFTVVPTTVREGKKLQVLDLAVVVDGVEHVRARVLRLRDADVSGFAGMPTSSTDEDPASALPPPEQLSRIVTPEGPAMMRAFDLRRAATRGEDRHAFWVRLLVDVVAGEPVRPTSLQTLAVDFTNCIGAALNPKVASTINPDVSAEFLRCPEGEWLAIVGDTRFDHRFGRGISHATLSDRSGVFGAATASQLVQPLARA